MKIGTHCAPRVIRYSGIAIVATYFFYNFYYLFHKESQELKVASRATMSINHFGGSAHWDYDSYPYFAFENK